MGKLEKICDILKKLPYECDVCKRRLSGFEIKVKCSGSDTKKFASLLVEKIVQSDNLFIKGPLSLSEPRCYSNRDISFDQTYNNKKIESAKQGYSLSLFFSQSNENTQTVSLRYDLIPYESPTEEHKLTNKSFRKLFDNAFGSKIIDLDDIWYIKSVGGKLSPAWTITVEESDKIFKIIVDEKFQFISTPICLTTIG
jgi:hypothetical protein